MSAGNREWCPPLCLSAAQRKVCQAPSVQEDLIFAVAGAREGQHATSTLRLCLHYNCDPKRISLFMRLLHFLLYRLGRAACWFTSSCFGLLYRAPVILLYEFQNYLAEGCKKGTRENRLTAILPQSSRSSRGIRDALPLVLAKLSFKHKST